jgi:hypothetical protein
VRGHQHNQSLDWNFRIVHFGGTKKIQPIVATGSHYRVRLRGLELSQLDLISLIMYFGCLLQQKYRPSQRLRFANSYGRAEECFFPSVSNALFTKPLTPEIADKHREH